MYLRIGISLQQVQHDLASALAIANDAETSPLVGRRKALWESVQVVAGVDDVGERRAVELAAVDIEISGNPAGGVHDVASQMSVRFCRFGVLDFYFEHIVVRA